MAKPYQKTKTSDILALEHPINGVDVLGMAEFKAF